MGGTGRYSHISYDDGTSEPTVKLRSANQPPEPVRSSEYDALMDAHPPTCQRNARIRVVLALMWYGGLRAGEVRHLKRSQIHLDTEHPRIEIRGSKYGKGRNVPVDPRLAPHIREWMQAAPESVFLVCTYVTPPPGRIAKGNPIGSLVSHGTPWDLVQRAAKRAGIERHLRPHMFRHAAATNWMRSGFTLREVQYLLGHANIGTTQRYLHVSDADVDRKMQGLARVPVARSEHVRCPFCASPIKRQATICRYCREDIPA